MKYKLHPAYLLYGVYVVKKIVNYAKPQLPNRREFLNSKNIITIVSAGLITITVGCSGNAKLAESAETNNQINFQSNSLTSKKLSQLESIATIDSIQTVNDSIKTTYPNPFMPTTTVKFKIGNDNNLPTDKTESELYDVKIEIFNAKGELVANLLNETRKAGVYYIDWSAEGQESGIYFYRITVDGVEMGVKKMVLMK